MKFNQVGIVACDTDALAEFYIRVFGCKDLRPRIHISGDEVSRPLGIESSETYVAWLSLPGVGGVVLEIFSFKECKETPLSCADWRGNTTLAFDVEDLEAVAEAVVSAGGSYVGEITRVNDGDFKFIYVFMRDLEGNMLDLKQWD